MDRVKDLSDKGSNAVSTDIDRAYEEDVCNSLVTLLYVTCGLTLREPQSGFNRHLQKGPPAVDHIWPSELDSKVNQIEIDLLGHLPMYQAADIRVHCQSPNGCTTVMQYPRAAAGADIAELCLESVIESSVSLSTAHEVSPEKPPPAELADQWDQEAEGRDLSSLYALAEITYGTGPIAMRRKLKQLEIGCSLCMKMAGAGHILEAVGLVMVVCPGACWEYVFSQILENTKNPQVKALALAGRFLFIQDTRTVSNRLTFIEHAVKDLVTGSAISAGRLDTIEGALAKIAESTDEIAKIAKSTDEIAKIAKSTDELTSTIRLVTFLLLALFTGSVLVAFVLPAWAAHRERA